MKTLAVLTVILSLVVMTGLADVSGRVKRQDWTLRGTLNAIGCFPTVLSAASTCNSELDERLKDFDREKIGDPGKCCWFAAFRKCVSDLAYKECGKDAIEVVDGVIAQMQRPLASECDSYTLYNPVCIFFVYLPYVIIGGVILALILIGCCLGACCCR